MKYYIITCSSLLIYYYVIRFLCMWNIKTKLLILLINLNLFSFSQDDHEQYKEYVKYLQIFFPLLPVHQVHIKQTSNQQDYKIYGLFTIEDLDNISYYLLNDESEQIWNFINNQNITSSIMQYIFVINNTPQSFKLNTYNIKNNYNYNANYIKDVKKIQPNIEIKEYTTTKYPAYSLRFTTKEKPLIIKLFKTNKSIKNLWFIYKHFDDFYGKEFVFFDVQQKEIPKDKAKQYYDFLFISFIYETIYTTIY